MYLSANPVAIDPGPAPVLINGKWTVSTPLKVDIAAPFKAPVKVEEKKPSFWDALAQGAAYYGQGTLVKKQAKAQQAYMTSINNGYSPNQIVSDPMKWLLPLALGAGALLLILAMRPKRSAQYASKRR